MSKIITSPFLLAAAVMLACPLAKADEPKKDGLWRGTGGAALAVSQGNTDSSAFNLNVDLAALTVQDKISLGGAYNYGKSKSTAGVTSTTADKWNTYGQYDYNLSSQTFVFGKVAFEGDKLIDLDLRSTVAGGLGYKLVDTKELSFNLFGGVAYSTDQYKKDQTIGSTTSKHFSRSSLFIGEESSHVLSASTSFKQRLEFYPGFTGDKAKIAKFSAGLAVAMSSTLNLSVGLTDSYNSAPPAGNKKNDLGLFTGVNLRLGSN